MSDVPASPFSARALQAFPPLLVELIRADARADVLLAEGFKHREIDAVRGLIRTEGLPPSSAPLDAGTEPLRLELDATAELHWPAAARDAVTTVGST